MEELFEKFLQRLRFTPVSFVRSIMHELAWDARLIGIRGARGVGKTTLLLQYIQLNLADRLHQTLYVSLDSIWFAGRSLTSLIDEFYKKGGKHLFLDEVHKYPEWARELKNAYDSYPDLKIAFTGSSSLEILNASADLSRRAIVYDMQGFSFREYLSLETQQPFEPISLEVMLETHVELAQQIVGKIHPLQYWEAYLKHGYYPFYQERQDLYFHRLSEVIQMILEIELPQLRSVEMAYIQKLKQLLSIVASSVPFSPNVSKLSEKIQINRNTLLTYLHYLDQVGLTRNLFKQASGISLLQKPSKIYLENTNLMYALAPSHVNKGNLRETFFFNQLSYRHALTFNGTGDFIVNGHTVFEIGGAQKSRKQIANLQHAYLVSDDIEIGHGRKIPLWLFGFLY